MGETPDNDFCIVEKHNFYPMLYHAGVCTYCGHKWDVAHHIGTPAYVFATDDDLRKAAALLAEHAKLREVLAEVGANIGYRGDGPLDRDEYYCEFCKEHHENYELIAHASSCLMTRLRSVFSNGEKNG